MMEMGLPERNRAHQGECEARVAVSPLAHDASDSRLFGELASRLISAALLRDRTEQDQSGV